MMIGLRYLPVQNSYEAGNCMVIKLLTTSFVVAAFGLGNPAWAQERIASARPPVVSDLTACRSISDTNARLACFDTAAETFDTSLTSGELLVVDRRQATAARRQAFGSTTAPADILQPPREEDRIDSISATLVSAIQDRNGRWTFALDDGSTWVQTDTDRVRIVNRAGETVRVRRGALGSYLLVVGRSGVVRVRRQ